MGDDLISRQEVIQAIGNLPSVQQKQNLAYWISKELGECSNCGYNGCETTSLGLLRRRRRVIGGGFD